VILRAPLTPLSVEGGGGEVSRPGEGAGAGAGAGGGLVLSTRSHEVDEAGAVVSTRDRFLRQQRHCVEMILQRVIAAKPALCVTYLVFALKLPGSRDADACSQVELAHAWHARGLGGVVSQQSPVCAHMLVLGCVPYFGDDGLSSSVNMIPPSSP
jgi:hypothetical protein